MAKKIDDTLIARALVDLDRLSADHVSEELSEEEKGLRLLADTDVGDEDEETFEQKFRRISEEIRRGDHSSVKAYVTQEALDELTMDLNK